MTRTGPTLTLLSGGGLAVALLALNLSVTDGGGTAAVASGATPTQTATPADGAARSATAAAPSVTPSASAPSASAPSAAAAPPTASATAPSAAPATAGTAAPVTYAGRLPKGAGTLALVRTGDQAVAYLCDGSRVEAWLSGAVDGDEVALRGTGTSRSSTLEGTLADGRLTGSVTVGGRSWSFRIRPVTAPSGLYRAAARVRGAQVVGGWIALEDGSVVGLGSLDGSLTAVGDLDPRTGRASVGAVPVTAARVDAGALAP